MFLHAVVSPSKHPSAPPDSRSTAVDNEPVNRLKNELERAKDTIRDLQEVNSAQKARGAEIETRVAVATPEKQVVRFSSGEPQYEGLVKEGRREGIWQEWDEAGTLRSKTSYQAGMKTGEYKQYDAAGQLIVSGTHLNDRRIGTWVFYDRATTTWTSHEYKKDED